MRASHSLALAAALGLASPLAGQTASTAVSLQLSAPASATIGDTVTLSAQALNPVGDSLSSVAYTWGADGLRLLGTTGRTLRAIVGRTGSVTVVARGLYATQQITASPRGPVTLPRSIPLWQPTPSGRTLLVRGSLQEAIDSARGGDVIELSGSHIGNFTLPARSDSSWVTIRSAQAIPDGRIDSITPLPSLVTPNAQAALRTLPGAHHWQVIGLQVEAAPSVTVNQRLVLLGSLDTLPLAHTLILDRIRIRAHDSLHTKQCLSLHSGATVVRNSRFTNCHADGQDSQAIGGWNGPGPYEIVNNHLETASEIIMFGGADPQRRGVIPCDITIRGNYLLNNPRLIDARWLIKNGLELKSACRVRITNNVLAHVWPDGQKGFGFNFKSVNQSGGCTWCAVSDIMVDSNYVHDVAGGVQLAAVDNAGFPPGAYLKRVYFLSNVFERVGQRPQDVGQLLFVLNSVGDVRFERNVGSAPALTIALEGQPMPRWALIDNVFGPSLYGIKGAGATQGSPTFLRYMPDAIVTGNSFAGMSPASYPAGNLYPASYVLPAWAIALRDRLLSTIR